MYQPEFNFSTISIVFPFGIVVIILLDVDASTLKLRFSVVTPFSMTVDGLFSVLVSSFTLSLFSFSPVVSSFTLSLFSFPPVVSSFTLSLFSFPPVVSSFALSLFSFPLVVSSFTLSLFSFPSVISSLLIFTPSGIKQV